MMIETPHDKAMREGDEGTVIGVTGIREFASLPLAYRASAADSLEHKCVISMDILVFTPTP